MQISILLISILVLTMINIFFVECRYSLFKIDKKVLENIEEKNKLSVSRCKKIKSKEKEFLSVCQSGIIISIITIGFLLEKICEFIFLRFEVADDTLGKILIVAIILISSILEAYRNRLKSLSDFLGKFLHHPEVVEKLLCKDTNHIVGGNRQQHAEDTGHASRNQDDEENLERMGLRPDRIEQRLQDKVIHSLREKNRSRDTQHQGENAQVGSRTDHTDENADRNADDRTEVGNHVQHADKHRDNQRIMPRKAENQQADRHQHRHDSGLGDDSCKVTNQQVGHRIERTGDVLFVFFRKHDDHHVVKESALLEEEKGERQNNNYYESINHFQPQI